MMIEKFKKKIYIIKLLQTELITKNNLSFAFFYDNIYYINEVKLITFKKKKKLKQKTAHTTSYPKFMTTLY